MDFKDQYKHPKWQKKRLSILKRDNWKCTICTNDERQLHVHHHKYPAKGKFIWNINNKFLTTVCDRCHGLIHKLKDEDDTCLSTFVDQTGISYYDVIKTLVLISKIENNTDDGINLIFNYLNNKIKELKDKKDNG